jgi:TatD DNase family protein
MMRLIDTHCHLQAEQFDADRAQALDRAREAGVVRLIEIGYDLATSRAAVALADSHDEVYAAVGWQPHYAEQVDEAAIEAIAALARHPKVVAIGEIGLDYHWMQAPPEAQERLFRRQLALARALDLPVVIHSRDAQDDTVRVLRDAARGQPGVMHSFSGGWAYAEACLEVGFLLSLSGPLTFPKSVELHEVARRAPLDRLLIETDSPYLSPHPLRGRRNEPANVRLVAERLAALRELEQGELAAQVWRNACALFGLPDDARA